MNQTQYIVDYHQLTFTRLHSELSIQFGDQLPIPIERGRFWSLIPPREYSPDEGRELLLQYLKVVERELGEKISHQSIAYWHHVYRRLAPGPIGEDRSPSTIVNTRAILDAAIQKYGRFGLCDRIASSKSVSIDEIFLGQPTGAEREFLKKAIQGMPQLVLTQFGVEQLREFYGVERLAYEIWKISAALRITGKGAGLQVVETPPFFFDTRSDELDTLVRSYDSRAGQRRLDAPLESRTGAVFENELTEAGISFFYQSNVEGHRFSWAAHWLEQNEFPVDLRVPLNFVPVPVNVRNFLSVHQPLADAFEATHGVGLEESLAVVASLGWMPTIVARATQMHRVLRAEQRAYDGAFPIETIEEWIGMVLPTVAKSLGCVHRSSRFRVRKVLNWLTLQSDDREGIDLCYPGPHSVLIPVSSSESDKNPEYFVDYAWILRRLHDLFMGVRVEDNNFKGEALERITRHPKMPLPHSQLFATDGSSRQVDASFGVGSRLFIVECRATSRSIGFERGQPAAIQYSRERIESTLRDVDEKAQWLAQRPTGRNYDITGFEEIVPVGVMPFSAFIPSLFEWYWLRNDVPRVLTCQELQSELSEATAETRYFNSFSVDV